MSGRVIEGFCGAGGASHGLSAAGFAVVGIEHDKDAAATHELAGHTTLCTDITTLDPVEVAVEYGPFDGMWMSPPCQDFSLAGLQAGITGERGRLVLEVLRWARPLRTPWIACEQVPPVLPIWEWFAYELRAIGYSTWTGILSAEEYGVPQTRKRAILMARRDGKPCLPPAPTHTAYDYRQPDGGRFSGAHADLFGDGLLPWVSMADALGWGMTERPGMTFAPGTEHGGPDIAGGSGARRTLISERERERGAWQFAGGGRTSEASAGQIPRDLGEPAHSVTGKATAVWKLRNGTQVNACVRSVDQPSRTLFFGPQANDVSWVNERPATTVAGDPRIGDPGHRDREGGERQFKADAVRVTVEQAAVLQGFPAAYPWQGSKISQYRQIGNAVPPPLAQAIASTFDSPQECKEVA